MIATFRRIISTIERFDALNLIENRWKSTPPEYKWGFVFGLITSALANGFALCHLVINEDGHQLRPDLMIYWKSGRWFMGPYASLREDFVSPFFIIAVSILFLVFAGCLNAAIWKARSRWTVAAIASLYGVFPAFAAAFSYVFVADIYAVSCLLSVLAPYFWRKGHVTGRVLGPICLMLSLALYQAFIALTAAICLLILILEMGDRELGSRTRPISLAKSAMSLLLLGFLGCACYLLSVKASILLHGNQALFEYRGINNLASLSLTAIPGHFKDTYRCFLEFLNGSYFTVPEYLKITIVATLIASTLLVMVRTWIASDRLGERILWTGATALALALVPPAVFITGFSAQDTPIDILQTFGVIAVLGACSFVMLEVRFGAVRTFALCVSFLMILAFVNRSNAINLKNYLLTEAAFATGSQILARVEELPEFNSNSRIAIIGKLPNALLPGVDESPLNEPSRGFYGGPPGLADGRPEVSSVKVTNLWKFLDVKVNPAQGNDFKVAAKEAVDMPSWPAAGSVKAIGDLIVVNLAADKYIRDVSIETKDDGHCIVTTKIRQLPGHWQYAWYILKGPAIIDKIWYGDSNVLDYVFKESGTYRVMAFVRSGDQQSVVSTAEFTVNVPGVRKN